MLSQSNLDVLNTLRQFKTIGLKIAFLVPTATGIKKSTMDATYEVRELLSKQKLHDFASQKQGEMHKVMVNTVIISRGEIMSTTSSLYRPKSKDGDPRIWPRGLKKLAVPTDLLAVLANRNGLVIINCSQSNLAKLLNFASKEFKNFLHQFLVGSSSPAEELLNKMKSIHDRGFIQTLRPGSTGVGFTLETLLGIRENSSKAPDFKGIEIKTKRERASSGLRSTLFSQVPNWAKSRLKNSAQILHERGYYDTEKSRIQLNQTIQATKPNRQNLQLNIDSPKDELQQIYTGQNPHVTDVVWDFPLLRERLMQKHRETFWITAETLGKNGDPNETFHYRKIKHTGNIDQSALPILLDLGVITVDYLIKELPSGAAKDHGYLFKMKPSDLNLLFDQVTEYDLDC